MEVVIDSLIAHQIRSTRRRGVKGQAGTHTDEYQRALDLYKENPLSQFQEVILMQCFGGLGVKHMLPTAKRLSKGIDAAERILRIEMRKEYALRAWFSRNWDVIFPHLFEVCIDPNKALENDEFKRITQEPPVLDPGLTEVIIPPDYPEKKSWLFSDAGI